MKERDIPTANGAKMMFSQRYSSFRRLLILAPIALVAAYGQASAQPQAWPTRPIKLVVPFAPGGATDVLARAIGERLQARLSQPVVIDNRPGASTMIGAAAVARSPADGYTLLLSGSSTFSALPALKSQIPYDPKKDFAPIGILAHTPMVLVAGPATQVKSLANLIELAKKKPGELTYSTYGPGSISHLAGEMFAHEAGVKIVPVPYKGGAPATMAAVSGEVTFTVDTLASTTPHVKSGRLRPLAIVGLARVSAFPDIPTMTELHLPKATLDAWYGLVAPAGTPHAVLDTLTREVTAILANPEIKEKMLAIGVDVRFSGKDVFSAKINSEVREFADIGKRANITMD